MVRFLINRPIAVIMSFIAIVVLGSIAIYDIPISLMPDIQIPEITIQVSNPNTSVREMETTIIKPLRRKLQQINNLEDIYSETKAGNGAIFLKFEYGTDNNISFIEVNEKIDLAMRDLPRDIERPKVIKANASDIPVFYLNIFPKAKVNDEKFLAISELCESVIKKRVEQLAEVAIADITGLVDSELYITPKKSVIRSIGISQNDIQKILQENNISYGNITVRDGLYQYNIRFSSSLRTIEDVKNIYLKVNNKVLQLKDIATIGIRQQQTTGKYLSDGLRAINIAIIKQNDAQIEELRDQINALIKKLVKDYPEIEISISQDQTSILNFTISNLKQSLFFGALLAFLMMFFFLKDIKSPLLIGFSIPTSLIISLLFFYIFNISINIISLSGLILGIGMMIDNSIIVIDNIIQHIENGKTVFEASVKGTNEVIRPLISSVLTTCAVFLPLIFLSGISGALFYDQAIAVSIGLVVSLIVSIILLPVLFRLFQGNLSIKNNKINTALKKYTLVDSEEVYVKGFNFIFSRRKYVMPLFAILILLSILLFYQVTKEKLPQVEKTEMVVFIDWNANLTAIENEKRVFELIKKLDVEASNAYIGEQQFLLDKDKDLGANETLIYLKAKSKKDLANIQHSVNDYFNKNYEKAIVSFKSYETIFDKLFADDQSDIVAKITSTSDYEIPKPKVLEDIKDKLIKNYTNLRISSIPKEDHIVIKINAEKIALYDISKNVIFDKLKSAFNVLQIDMLKSSQKFLPIVISDNSKSIQEILKTLTIANKNDIEIPISDLIQITRVYGYKSLLADKSGSYIPLFIDWDKKNQIDTTNLISQIKNLFKEYQGIEVTFAGQIFSGDKILTEMIYVLIISVMFLYFILAAQFESLLQPLIVLLEIPLDITGALAMLLIFGESLNIMSMIGIIVMSGIIINDSILKIATINQLRAEGNDLIISLHLAGKKRLKPILMTSLTTILALLPFLFYSDLGSELQKPFALAVIGGMLIGTLVSLYFIPLCYYYLYYRKNNVKVYV